MTRSSLNSHLDVSHAISVCAAELDQVAQSCSKMEPVIGKLLAVKGASLEDITILQDLDRVQQYIISISQILHAAENDEKLKEVTNNLRLVSLRSKILSESASSSHVSGEVELF